MKQNKVKSSTGENDTIKRRCKHKRYEAKAAAGVTQHVAFQHTFVIKQKEYTLK